MIKNSICIGILFAIGAILLATGGYLVSYGSGKMEGEVWKSTSGNVTASRCDQDSRNNLQCDVDYAYSVDGKSYTGSVLTGTSYSGKITVYYRPNQPETSSLSNIDLGGFVAFKAGIILLAFGSTCVVIALLVVCCIAYRRVNPRPADVPMAIPMHTTSFQSYQSASGQNGPTPVPMNNQPMLFAPPPSQPQFAWGPQTASKI
jgi:hypothetical protein